MVKEMRIKAVLRDGEILGLEPGTKERIVATAMKNLERVVSLSSFLKVMGLKPEDRIRMLDELTDQKVHIWLGKDAQQDIVFLFKSKMPEELQDTGYQWQ